MVASKQSSKPLNDASSERVELFKSSVEENWQPISAVDGASSSGYTSLAIRSKDELVAGPNKSSSPTTPIPSTSINSISKSFPSKMNPNTNPATSIESKEDDYIHTTIVKDPQWPSSVTLRKANSRLDQAGRELLVGNKLGREQTIDLFSPYPRTYNGKYTDDPESFDPSPSSSRGSNRTQNIANNDSSPNIPSGSFKKNSTTPTNTTAIIDSNGRTRARPPLTINKNARPAHPRTRKIQRSMTDPMQLTQHLQPLNAKEPNGSRKHVSFESAEEGEDETDDFNKDNHRWFRGPDIDSWRVGS
ncbi:hypothetical protein BX616_000475 [Lobosporangium transversale]|nr:hypothetical protein BX616_000475 [Lobosporangium transversale]